MTTVEKIQTNNLAQMDARLTMKQAAEETGIPIPTLRTYRQLNKGPASFRLGGKVFYLRSEIERWVAEEMAATRRGGV